MAESDPAGMEDENLDLEDLAALLDEDDDELFAMVDASGGDEGGSKSTSSNSQQTKDVSQKPSSPVASTSNTTTGFTNLKGGSSSTPPQSNISAAYSGEPDRASQTVASDLALSDEETPRLPSTAPAEDDDPDDPDESEILALEAKLAKLKQKKQSKQSPKSLQDVVSKIKKPPTPNKSRFLDTTGIVPSTVVPAELPPSQRTSLEQRVRAMLRRPASEVHGGDTDSSEDEDNRQPFEQRYNEFGRTVKRIAHASASGTGRDRLQERAEHVNRAAQRALKPKTAAKKADGGRPAVPEQPHEEIMIDSFAKISVINPRLTSIELRDCLQGKRLIRVSQLENNVRADGIPGDWVTIGVIARKSDPRTSQKGSAYSSWTLTDLVDVQKPVKVMLFGEAHSALWKTTVGTVVALANSKVMKDKEMSGSTGITISVVSGKHCIMLGTSPDLDFCKAKCKNGRICLSFINKRHCPVCVFHMTAEYKKTGSKRGELQGVSSVAPKKPLGGGVGGAGGQILHEGAFSGGALARRDSETAAQKLKDRERLTSLRLQKQCEDTLNTKKKKLDTAGLKHISQAEAKAIANVAEDSMEMGELLLKPCAGARNLLRHLTKDSTESTSTDLAEPRPARRTAADPAAMLREEAARRRVAEKALAAPRLARHVTPGQTVDLDVSPQQRAVAGSAAKARALALLKKSGPLKKTDPNAVRSRPSDQRRELVKKRLEREADENIPGVPALRGADPGPAAKRSRLADDPAFRAVLEARSSHAAALEAELTEGQEHYFQALEKKELVENKMLTTWEVKTKAVYCKKCKYRALSASDLCKSEGHTTILLDAVKRFFSCNNCKSRTISLDKLPRLPCQNCGGESWQKAPMGKERTGPKLESEILSIRGNEAFSINSHVKEHNINLEF
ncbi:protein MCM10 homolog isoform X2 [Amphibalanus amphitrite]|uniref:protein MCM10 homolog isoform X2 n=2 Tax=Amphibalanus amphitrite TaxID=1232801 RepID=UPI001C913346|nr:protein MCM10 homolog isoform X2 [Amphibalanus amphitrite]